MIRKGRPAAAGAEVAISAADDERWAAVTRRDGRADGTFYYSVHTTRIYCRPSCPSRLPRRENVVFHGTWEEAERAGFRPCKRCRPNEPGLEERRAAAIARACRLVEDAGEMPALAALAAAAGMSRFHFHRVFKAVTGLTPRAYVDAHLARRVRDELGRAGTVTEAIYEAGFSSASRFYSRSSEVLGMTPTDFRSGGDGARVRFAVGECSLGSILVAATEKGVCSILLGDDPDVLLQDLDDYFPNAELIGDDPDFEAVVARVVGFVESPAVGLDLPLDVRGTAFQQRVRRALLEREVAS